MVYIKYVGEILQFKIYGYNSVEEFLGVILQVVWIKGYGYKRIVVLKNDMKSCLSLFGFFFVNFENQFLEGECILEVFELYIVLEFKFEVDGSGFSYMEQEFFCLIDDFFVDFLCVFVFLCLLFFQLRLDFVIF